MYPASSLSPQDVKLENVMLSRTEGKGTAPVAKLVDLGLHTVRVLCAKKTHTTVVLRDAGVRIGEQ